MKNELEDYPEDYLSLTYEDCCELLSTIEVKEERKRAASHIKKIASAREDYIYESNKSVRINRKKKERTGVVCSNNPIKRRTNTMGPRTNTYLARRQEFPSESICCIVLRTAGACVPTRPSRME